MRSSAARSTFLRLVVCVAVASGWLVLPGGATAFVQAPALHLDVTVGPNDGSGACPTETSVSGPSGMSVTYCYRITNTGSEPLTAHELVDEQRGEIALPGGDPLDPIESGWDFFIVEAEVVLQSTTTTATWTAAGAVTGLTAQDSASATVTVIPPELGVTSPSVIAQGLADLDDGRYACTMTAIALAESRNAIAIDAPTFLYADGPVARYHLEHAWPSSPPVVLGAGEAVYAGAGTVGLLQQVVPGSTPTDAALYEISISPADGSDDDALEPGAGSHDIDLIRAILGPGASLTVPGPGPGAATCAFVPHGTVMDTRGRAIAAATATYLTGEFAITNPGVTPATVLLVVISPTLHVPSTESSTAPPVTSPPTAAPTTQPTRTTIPTTAAATTTTTWTTTTATTARTTTTTATTSTSLPPSFTTTTSTTSPVIVSPTTPNDPSRHP